MTPPARSRPRHHRAEFISDAAVQIAGLVAALIAVPVLVTLTAVWRGDLSAMLGTLIYGATLIAMLLCSTLYHLIRHPDWRRLLRRLDHSAIYFKIAGTYTPFALLSGGHGAALLTGLWGAALAGSALRIVEPDRFRWIAFALYLGMGWAGLVAGSALFEQLSDPVMTLILAGGVLYTVGTIFFLWELLPFNGMIWHVFVVIASGAFYAAVLVHLSDTSTALALLAPGS